MIFINLLTTSGLSKYVSLIQTKYS